MAPAFAPGRAVPGFHASDEDPSPGTPGLPAESAMWAFHAGLKTLVAAVGAWNQNALRPGQKVNDQADKVSAEDQQHPQHGAVHAAGLGVASHPHQQGDADGQERNGNKNEGSATAAAGQCAGWIVVVLRQANQGSEQDCDQRQS